VRSPHQYLADLNNDGTDELIARIWQPDATGQRHYSFRLFNQQSGYWSLFKLSPPLAENTWFYIDRVQNQNYLVTYTAMQEWQENRLIGNRYQFRIYRLQGAQLIEIGMLQAHSR
jgi:hypothetical protein